MSDSTGSKDVNHTKTQLTAQYRADLDLNLNTFKYRYPDVYYRHIDAAYRSMVAEVTTEQQKKNQDFAVSMLQLLLQMADKQ